MDRRKEDIDRIQQYLDKLSDVQKAAAVSSEKVLRVIAGPGSGKTHVLVGRAAYLLGSGIHPSNILLLTFTNKAAKEMKERLRTVAGDRDGLRSLWAGTFHRLANRIVRNHVHRLGDGRTDAYQIIDEGEIRQILLSCLMERESVPIYEDDSTDVKKAKQLQNRELKKDMSQKSKMMQSLITRTKESLKVVHNLDGNKVCLLVKDKISPALHKEFCWCYDRYHEELRRMNLFDFQDLLSCAVWLLTNKPDVRHKYKMRFLHVCVDEMQDTDSTQYEMLRILTAESPKECASGERSLFVVGDPNQGIYSFRGANMEHMVSAMEQDFKPSVASQFLLENYRSAEPIVRNAERLLDAFIPESAYKRMNVIGERKGVRGVEIKTLDNSAEEAAFVVGYAKFLQKRMNLEWTQIAVLYRSHFLSRDLETELTRAKIPHFVHSKSFWDREEVKDIIAYLRIIGNPRDTLAFERIYNKPSRGFGITSFANAAKWCKKEGKEFPAGLFEDVLDLQKDVDSVEEVEIPTLKFPKSAKISKKAQEGLHAFRQMFVFLRSKSEKESVRDVVDAVMEDCGYEALIWGTHKEMNSEIRTKLNNVCELQDVALQMIDAAPDKGLAAVQSFVQEAALLVNTDARRNKDGIQLMTVHAAKGLEFDVVFVVGCEEGIFPTHNALESGGIKEEARTLYVAMTRAKAVLILTSSAFRMYAGKPHQGVQSRFLRPLTKGYSSTRDVRSL